MKILSIDGGGVFGAIPAYLLRNIDTSKFDAYAGTSIGSVLALSYALGNDPIELYNKFMKQIPSVFSDTNYFFMARPKYKDKNLNIVLLPSVSVDKKDFKNELYYKRLKNITEKAMGVDILG